MRCVCAAILLLFAGCTQYEFDLTRPVDLSTHIGTKADAVITREPLEYRFRAYESHLIIRIFNPTEEAIELLGVQSTVVDPAGQSHSFRGATIEPSSFVQLVLPPVATVAPYGPSVGFSIGGGYSRNNTNSDAAVVPVTYRHYRRYFYGGYYGWPYYYPWSYGYYAPQYYVLYDGDQTYWEWRGETEVRLALSFQRNGKTFRDEFTFRRVKAK